MPTFLLTWNPTRWAWQDVKEAARTTALGQIYQLQWSCGNTKAIRKGDRVFLLRQGVEPKGIVASGWTTSDTYEARHWDEGRAESGKSALHADVDFDRILDANADVPLSTAEFTSGPLAAVYWSIPASGTQIPEDAAEELESSWEDHLAFLEGRGARSKPRRNPPWQRDELILALDLYVRRGGKYLSEADPEIIELSRLLNTLPIHGQHSHGETFRNANGVSMKLLNFRRFDPSQAGTGLNRGNRLEDEVWAEFSGDPERLSRIAEAIRSGGSLVGTDAFDEEEESFPEGKVLYRLHRQRERSRSLVERAKVIAKKNHDRLVCAACNFDFAARYGDLGRDFIEAHHTLPLSELVRASRTKPSEIALLCSNCHRMIHRKRPWLSIDELTSLIDRKKH